MQSETVILLLGSDIEPRMQYLQQAEALIEEKIGDISAASSVYESEPWGFESDTKFLNKVLVINTHQSPQKILQSCQDIENFLGRTRNNQKGYTSRTIDVDILYYGRQQIETDHLKIPHPAITERRFTLLPLTEVIPQWLHPVLEKTQTELLKNCQDTANVVVFKEKENAL